MKNKLNIALAVYKKEEYKEIRNLSDDKNDMDETWEEWMKSKQKTKKNFKIAGAGVKIKEVEITVKELKDYCRKNGMRINGAARSGLAASKLDSMNS